MESDSDELAEFVAEQMCLRIKKHTIKRNLEILLFGEEEVDGVKTGDPTQKIGIGVFEKLSSRARALMRARANRPPAENVENAIDLYESIIADPRTPRQTLIKAQQALTELIGTSGTTETPDQITAAIRQSLKEGLESFGSDSE